MKSKISLRSLSGARRPSRLGDLLAKQKIDSARALTPEQRLLVAIDLSDTALLLQRACFKKP